MNHVLANRLPPAPRRLPGLRLVAAWAVSVVYFGLERRQK